VHANGPKGSNLAKDDGFLMAIKICNMTSFGRKLKPSIPFHGILKIPRV
jgi:hypothetical protein